MVLDARCPTYKLIFSPRGTPRSSQAAGAHTHQLKTHTRKGLIHRMGVRPARCTTAQRRLGAQTSARNLPPRDFLEGALLLPLSSRLSPPPHLFRASLYILILPASCLMQRALSRLTPAWKS